MKSPSPAQNSLQLVAADVALQPFIEYLAVGADPELEQQLIQKSHESNILKYTPNDAKKRFGDTAMLKRWLAKGREIHWLLGPDRDLAGIMWYGQEPFPIDMVMPEMPKETLAIRLYEGYAGHHLALPFMGQSLRLAVQRKQARGENINGLWLQTDVSNAAAAAVYTKFGYHEVARDQTRITMVLSVAEVLALAQSAGG